MKRSGLALLALLLTLWLAVPPAWADIFDPIEATRQITAQGDALAASYRPEQKQQTIDAVSALYFDRFEGPLDQAVGAIDPALKGEIEAGFAEMIGLARRGAPPEAVQAAWGDLRGRLDLVPVRIGGVGFWRTLGQSALILIREGVEALLVVSALLTFLRRTGAERHERVVFQGVAWAVAASLAMAWALSEALALSGPDEDAIEGVTMLLAAAVLFYCCWWLVAKREFERWQAYIKDQIGRAAAGGRLFAIGFAAFLAVFREGAETVLFYQALAAAAPGQGAALSLGIAVAVLALAGIYLTMRFLSVRLPLRLFFNATAALLYYLAISFAGDGVVELQTARLLPATALDGWPTYGWIGFHPTLEGIAAQALLVLPSLAVGVWWLWQARPRRDRAAHSP